MSLRNSLLAYTSLIVLATSCIDNTAPEVSYGFVKISVRTTGGDLDDAYDVLVGPERSALPQNGSFAMTVTPGPATVELTGVASNCLVQGSRSVSVDVPRGKTAEVTFLVACWATGFQVRVVTSGEDLPGYYTLDLTGQGPRRLAANDSVVLSKLEPGTYTIRLGNAISSCATTSPNELTVDLPPRTVVPVLFKVACTAPVRPERIAYQVDSSSGSIGTPFLALAKPDGTEQTAIVEGTAPSWSPGRNRLAYASDECAYYYYYDDFCTKVVRVIDPETLNSRILAVGTMPAWSPRDDVIAFVELNGSLAFVAANGSDYHRSKVPDSLDAGDPAWSPDGQAIAFACHTPHGFSRLCLISKDGSGFRQLTDFTSDPASHPAWSHDGTTIVFSSVDAQGITSIATIAPAGGAITKLTEGFDPAWSRDGTRLIFARSDGLFTMNADGSGVQRVTTGRHRAPAWRP